MAGGKFTEKTRRLIAERAKGWCELCGLPLRTAAQIHHRRPRGMGGTSSTEAQSPANGLWIHFKCHERVERFREQSLKNGWLVPQGHSPHRTPVLTSSGWRLLDDQGGSTPYEPSGQED